MSNLGEFKNSHHLLGTMPTDAILSEAARRRRAMQTTPPTPEKLRACLYCKELFGARRMRKHAPVCRREWSSATYNHHFLIVQ